MLFVLYYYEYIIVSCRVIKEDTVKTLRMAGPQAHILSYKLDEYRVTLTTNYCCICEERVIIDIQYNNNNTDNHVLKIMIYCCCR